MENKNLKLQQMYTEAVQNQQKGNSAVAEDLYKKILKELPNHVNTQGNLGALYAQIGRDAEAKVLLQNVLKIEPYNINANSNLGIVFTHLS